MSRLCVANTTHLSSLITSVVVYGRDGEKSVIFVSGNEWNSCFILLSLRSEASSLSTRGSHSSALTLNFLLKRRNSRTSGLRLDLLMRLSLCQRTWIPQVKVLVASHAVIVPFFLSSFKFFFRSFLDFLSLGLSLTFLFYGDFSFHTHTHPAVSFK